MKDNYGNKKKVHIKDVKPIEMDIATAEFFRKERKQCTTRDAKHVMPIKLIPDLEWKFIENIDVVKSDKGVQIYCLKETEDEHEDTQVTEVSEPRVDRENTENIKPVVTETGEAPRTTQSSRHTNASEIGKPRYEHRESSETAAEDAVPREITEKTELTENTGIAQATLVDSTEDTETDVSEQTVAEQVEVTHTTDITELVTCILEPTLEATSKENEESTTTSPGSPQRENPEVQNKSRDNTKVNTEQAAEKTHQYPKANNSIVNKIFSAFRQAKESLDIIPM